MIETPSKFQTSEALYTQSLSFETQVFFTAMNSWPSFKAESLQNGSIETSVHLFLRYAFFSQPWILDRLPKPRACKMGQSTHVFLATMNFSPSSKAKSLQNGSIETSFPPFVKWCTLIAFRLRNEFYQNHEFLTIFKLQSRDHANWFNRLMWGTSFFHNH